MVTVLCRAAHNFMVKILVPPETSITPKDGCRPIVFIRLFLASGKHIGKDVTSHHSLVAHLTRT